VIKTRKFMTLTAACLLVAAGAASGQSTSADQKDAELVYRDAAGNLPAASERALKRLSGAAEKHGFVELWLSLDSQKLFGGKRVSDVDLRRKCANILKPLADSGDVIHPSKGPTNFGAICFVRATSGGVLRLAEDDNFRQILGTTHGH